MMCGMNRSNPSAGIFTLNRFVLSSFIHVVLLIAGLLAVINRVDADDPAPGGKVTPRAAVHSVPVSKFQQQVRRNFTGDEGLKGAIHQLAIDHSLNAKTGKLELDAATDTGIARFAEGRWETIYEAKSPVIAIEVAGPAVRFIQDGQLFELTGKSKPKPLAKSPAGVTLRSLLTSDGVVYLGTTNGLSVLKGEVIAPVVAVNQLLGDKADIRQIAAANGEVVVAASGGLISLNRASQVAKVLVPRDTLSGWALQDVRGVGFGSDGNLWFAAPQGVGQRTKEGWKLYTGEEGLPYNDFTGLATGPNGDVWFGTRMGAIRYSQGKWEYRQGKRWLADDVVNSIVVNSNGDAWFATPAGVTQIESRPTTLSEKSKFFNSEIDERHRRTPFGYVDAVALEKPGDKSKWTHQDSDNDGLWTSMYGAAQCFEYAATHTAESKKRANDAFRAVGFLSEVPQGGAQSPPVGFPARTILPTSGRNPNDHDSPEHDQRRQKRDPLWKVIAPRWPVSADGKWYWKSDTSSDELDGQYFFYALYNDLVAESDEEKQYVRAVVDRVTTHLIEHDYTLIDHDGQPTRWGHFGPSALNTDFMTDLRGLNALSILSYLLVAEHVTGNPKYRREYEKLLFEHNYFTNVLNPKYQNGPGSGNQSDDEMAFMCYYNLLTYEKDPKIRHQYMRSLVRYFQQEEPEACPLFNFIFAAFYDHVDEHWESVPASIIEDSVDQLRRFPLDRVDWGYQNSHRLDVVLLGSHILESKGKGHLRSGKVIPIDEQFVNHWNHDPWRLDSKRSGRELADGASYLLPYWLGVYHGFVKETPAPAGNP